MDLERILSQYNLRFCLLCLFCTLNTSLGVCPSLSTLTQSFARGYITGEGDEGVYIFFFQVGVAAVPLMVPFMPQVRVSQMGCGVTRGCDSVSFPLPDEGGHAEHPGPVQGAAGSQSGPVLPVKKGCSASYHSQ